MAIADRELKAIDSAPTGIGAFKATLDALAVDGTISRDVAGIVKLALDQSAAKLEPALRANLKDIKEADALNRANREDLSDPRRTDAGWGAGKTIVSGTNPKGEPVSVVTEKVDSGIRERLEERALDETKDAYGNPIKPRPAKPVTPVVP